ncbi:hypothetical protein D9M72_324700 [compost metagenome]
MQVGRAAVEGFGQQLLQEAHHRGVVDIVGGGAVALVAGRGHRIVFDHLALGLHRRDVLQRAQGLAGGAHVLHQLVVLDHHRFDRQLVLFLDRIQPGLVGRVGHRQHQPVLAPAQRQQPVRVEFTVAGKRRRHLGQVVLGQVQQRQLVLVRGKQRQVVRAHGAAADDLVDQLRLLFTGGLLQLSKQGGRDTPALGQGKTECHGRCAVRCG